MISFNLMSSELFLNIISHLKPKKHPFHFNSLLMSIQINCFINCLMIPKKECNLNNI